MGKTIFELAQNCIESRQQWPAGHSEVIWTGRVHKAFVREGGRDGGGLLFLGLRNGKPGQEALCVAGMLNPLEGWVFTLTDYSYQRWVRKAQRLAGQEVTNAS